MKLRKSISIILVVLLAVALIIPTISLADYSPQKFKDSGHIKTEGDGVTNVKSVGGKVVGIIQVVGTIAAVATMMVLGIKYMMGSAEERAEYKKTLFPYIVGAVLIFAASNLTQVIYKWAITLK